VAFVVDISLGNFLGMRENEENGRMGAPPAIFAGEYSV
jgi:hypothetical protein